MTVVPATALSMTMLMALITCCISLNAQVASSVGQSASISVSITMEKDVLVVGQKPRTIVTVKNISNQEICFSTASRLYRVHVERIEFVRAPFPALFHCLLPRLYRPSGRERVGP